MRGKGARDCCVDDMDLFWGVFQELLVGKQRKESFVRMEDGRGLTKGTRLEKGWAITG